MTGTYKNKFTLFSRRDDRTPPTAVSSSKTVKFSSVSTASSIHEMDKDVLFGEEGLSDEVAAIVEEVFASYGCLLERSRSKKWLMW